MLKKTSYLLGVTLFLLGSSCRHTAPYQFTIVDDQTGEQISARVSLVDACGNPVNIDGDPSHVDYMGKRWCYTDGSFSVTSQLKGVSMEVMHGLETLPTKISLDNSQAKRTIQLHRWTDMNKKGYLIGDVHIHTPFSELAQLQMQAEDLDIINILLLEDSARFNLFTGHLDPASTPGHAMYINQEVRDWQMGHLTLVGNSSLIPDYYPSGGNLHNFSINPHWLMNHAMDESHQQGGLVLWSHFSNLPGAEFPLAMAFGKVDAIELMTYDDPTHLPSHQSPWKNSQLSQAEYPVMRGMDLYYQYLNAGFQLPIVAGTDKMGDDIPMGSNRYYAFTNGDPSYEAWLEAIKLGRGFITNGPILEFQVEGYSPGDVVVFQNSMKEHVRFSVRSVLPFATIEIILNGSVVAEKTIFTNQNPPVNGVYEMVLETDVVFNESSWIAARVADDPDNKHRILPRGLSVFAHTNPIYFLKDGAKVHEEASILYLQKSVQGTINWLQTNPPFKHPEDRLLALKLAQQAYGIYEVLR